MEHEGVETRPTRDGIQAVRWKLGWPIAVIRLRVRTPILASVFWIFEAARLELVPDDGLPAAHPLLNTAALIVAG